MPADYLKDVLRPNQTVNPLFRFLNIQIHEVAAEKTIFTLEVTNDVIQGAGVVAGGIISTLLDEAMAHAALACVSESQRVATTDMQVRFFKPALEGDTITAEAYVLRRGRRLIITEASLFNSQRTLLSKSDASFIILD